MFSILGAQNIGLEDFLVLPLPQEITLSTIRGFICKAQDSCGTRKSDRSQSNALEGRFCQKAGKRIRKVPGKIRGRRLRLVRRRSKA